MFCEEKEKIYNIAMLLKKKFEMFQDIQVQGKRNTSRGVLVRNLSVRFYIVGRVRLRMGANAQIGEN